MKNLSKSVKIAIIIAATLILCAIIIAIIIGITNRKATLEIYDSKTGYKTTFKYPRNKGYEIKKINTDTGTFPEVTFTNESQNINFEIYYYETSHSLFERNKNLRKNNDNYTEYTFGEYSAYSYTAGNVLQSDILLNQSDEDRDLVLYIYMDRYDSQKEGDMHALFTGAEIQKILDTIKFEKVEAK